MKEVTCICGIKFETRYNEKGCSPECKQALIHLTYLRTLAKKYKGIYYKEIKSKESIMHKKILHIWKQLINVTLLRNKDYSMLWDMATDMQSNENHPAWRHLTKQYYEST